MDIVLTDGSLRLTLSESGEYYQGTRFDWAGVFKRIEYDGQVYADIWLDGDDPRIHDHLCGTSEEFLPQLGYDEAPIGGRFLKLGVGWLEKDTDGPYDWFRTYPLADAGTRTLETDTRKAVFTHTLDGCYHYLKAIELTGEGSYRITHRLKNLGTTALKVEQYNHNFFTFGLTQVRPGRSLEFDFPIEGDWRPDTVNAAKDSRTIRITAPMQQGQKAYMGNIRTAVFPAGDPSANANPHPGGYAFTLRSENALSVRVTSDRKMSHTVFWSNHRVFCPEPYIPIDVRPGQEESWWVSYRLG